MSSGELNQRKEQLWQKQSQLNSKISQRNSYLATAREIGEIYNRLAAMKAKAKNMKQSVAIHEDRQYEQFKGNLRENTYGSNMHDVTTTYGTLVFRIDQNLYALNNERIRYENMAYECDGAIGVLERGISYLGHTIQKWIN